MSGATDQQQGLLISWLAEHSGLANIADLIGYGEYTDYLYLGLLVFINWGVLAVVQFVTVGYHPLAAYPVGWLPALAGFGGMWASRHLVNKYHNQSREELREVVSDPDTVPATIAPWKLQIGIYVILAGGMVVWLLQPGTLAKMRTLQGPLGLPRHVMIYFLLRLPIVAEASTVVLGALLLVPWRLCHGNLTLKLDFSDPSRLGGLKSTAELLRRSTQVYFLGMFAVTLFALAPRLFPDQPGVGVLSLVSLGIVGAWLAGFGLFGVANLCLHRKMKDEKDEKMERLREQLISHGSDSDPFPDYEDMNDHGPDEMLPYLYIERSLRQTELTQEYPTNKRLVRGVVISSAPSIGTYLLTLVLTALRF